MLFDGVLPFRDKVSIRLVKQKGIVKRLFRTDICNRVPQKRHHINLEGHIDNRIRMADDLVHLGVFDIILQHVHAVVVEVERAAHGGCFAAYVHDLKEALINLARSS